MALDLVAPFPPLHSSDILASSRRMRTDWQAELRLDGSRFRCTVADVSSLGAMLRLIALPPAGSQVELLLPANPPIPAQIVWRRQSRLGLRFLEPQPWVAELGMRCPFAWSR